ncbi:MAG: DUF4301 domain-containing protein [Deltaproteobacteria bacterium]|nr:MAG: DUF4301 domain-containing protein [Deltaproteobacteria bacterium]
MGIEMLGSIFSHDDIRQIKERGLTVEKVMEQLEVFKKGFPYARLNRPCTVGDGIHVLEESDLKRLTEIHENSTLSGRAMKFVPASGAATRMFKLLTAFNNRYNSTDEAMFTPEALEKDSDTRAVFTFLKGLKRLAFYQDLKNVMARDGLDPDTLLSKGIYKPVLDYLLTPAGLNLAHLPKGLIKFHTYPGHSRTPFEEHLVEAAGYVRDAENRARVHFTVSAEHEAAIREHIEEAVHSPYLPGVRYEVSFSNQSPSTDTIAVDMDNKPFRNRDGRLVFRPGGHGALLQNLNDLRGDIIFIKNIDNVVPDRLKADTYAYKKALGGFLVELQARIFSYVEKLSKRDLWGSELEQVLEFLCKKLFTVLPQDVGNLSREEKIRFALSKLNRPLRVCGVVRNVGEPGGGPFWVEHSNGGLSLQIVESAQVDMSSSKQRKIWESATHFNPVDIVCGVRDYRGRQFHLPDFVDPDTGFISIKSKDGKELKALELPGLWNGSMAKWNTVFVEVPISTFNPVKTVFDLLRKEHQPE